MHAIDGSSERLFVIDRHFSRAGNARLRARPGTRAFGTRLASRRDSRVRSFAGAGASRGEQEREQSCGRFVLSHGRFKRYLGEQGDNRNDPEKQRANDIAREHEHAAVCDEREDGSDDEERERARAEGERDCRDGEERDENASDDLAGFGACARCARPRTRDLDARSTPEDGRPDDAAG
jgi:hypothetical protein